jgi:hypothetical protein
MQDDDEAAFLAGADATPAPETPPAEPAQAPEPAPEAEAATAGTETPSEPETPANEPEKPAGTDEDWRDRRMARLTAQAREAERQVAAEREQRARIEAELRTLKGEPETTETKPDIDIAALARQMVEHERFQESFAKWDEAGVKADPEFRDNCARLADLGGNQRPDFAQVLMDLDDSPRVVAELAKDPERAERILHMPSHKMALEIAKIAAKTTAPAAPRVSKAPEPVRPLGGPGRTERDPMSDDAPMDVWIKEHDKREAARRAASR